MARLSTRQLRSEWAEYECTEKDWATIEFLGRAPVKTIKRLVDAWSAAERALIATGYGKASIVGSYNCRDIEGGAGRSLHAFRLALDIDPGPNRRQGKGARMDWAKCKITRDPDRTDRPSRCWEPNQPHRADQPMEEYLEHHDRLATTNQPTWPIH